jgi:hypothetical protein
MNSCLVTCTRISNHVFIKCITSVDKEVDSMRANKAGSNGIGVAIMTHERFAADHFTLADVVLLKWHASGASKDILRTWCSGKGFQELKICGRTSLNKTFHISS